MEQGGASGQSPAVQHVDAVAHTHASNGKQLASPLASACGETPSALEPQLPGPAALSTSPPLSIRSPPLFHVQQTTALGDPLPLCPSHDRTASRSFSDAPTAELPPIQSHRESISSTSNHTLPSLSSVTSGLQPSTTEPGPPKHWPSLNPYTTFYTPSYAQPAETPSPRHPGAEMNAASPERFSERRSTSVSLDDPDVRMAAEALGDLRADFVSSPPNRNNSLPGTPRDPGTAAVSPGGRSESQPEPLFSLLTASHPLVATTIEGAASVYTSSKDYSPRIKVGAEYIEGYLSPVAKVVGNVSRKTGVDIGMRWFLSRKYSRKHSGTDLEPGASHKRFKGNLSAKEKEALDRSFPMLDDSRRTSISTIDTLPAYDDQRSPSYSEAVGANGQAVQGPEENQVWGSRFVVSTSSLAIAMRAESLRNLKYCLKQLRLANGSVTELMNSLQHAVDQYDVARSRKHSEGAGDSSSHPSEDQTRLLAQIDSLKKGIASSVKDIIKLVSDYAGNAVPENVQHLIRDQVTGFPQRWHARKLQESASGEGARTEQDQGTRGALLLAKEALHLITQVSDVIDRTIKSAEEWCTKLGKGAQDGLDNSADKSEQVPSPAMWATPQPHPTSVGADHDTQMTG